MKRRVCVWLLAATALLAVIGACKPVTYYLEKVYKVHGTVTVAEGGPGICSVEVFVGDYQYSELTNYFGEYELELAEGTWSVRFQKDGFEPASGEVTVGPDCPRIRLDVEMVPLNQDGTVEVWFSDAGLAEGMRVLVAVYPEGTDTSIDPIGAMAGTGDFDIIGGSGGQVLEVPWVGGEVWYATGGESYDLYLWVDMNANLQEGVYFPEPGVDLQLAEYPSTFTVAGDVVCNFTGADLVVTPSTAAEDGTITALLSGAGEHEGEKFMIAVFPGGVRDYDLAVGWNANNIVDGAAAVVALACSPDGVCSTAIYAGGGSYDIIMIIFAGDFPVDGDPYAETNGVVVDGDVVISLECPKDFGVYQP